MNSKQSNDAVEDVLASIREIISHDVAKAPKATAYVDQPRRNMTQGEDVLDLTDMITETGEIVVLRDRDEYLQKGAASYVNTAPAQVPAPASYMNSSPASDPYVNMAPAIQPQPTTVAVETPKSSSVDVRLNASPIPPRDDNDLISSQTATEALGALSGLIAAKASIAAQEKVAQTNGNTSLEELVQITLRPLLKEWINANLPNMVKAVVEEEIQKLHKRV